MEMKIFELYITKNKVNGSVYGGKHTYTNNRGSYIGSGYRLKRAIKKYGRENFDVRVLKLRIVSQEDLDNREIRMIRLLKHLFKNKCYNLHKGGSGGNYYHYLEPEERLEMNKKISEGKKKQYEQGRTHLQILGSRKQSQTLKRRNAQDEEFRAKMILAQKRKGEKLSKRIAERGLTELERRRNEKRVSNGLYQYVISITFPSGRVEIETTSSKRFKLKYKTDDSLFSTLAREGTFKIRKRLPATKHSFPKDTVFRVLNRL